MKKIILSIISFSFGLAQVYTQTNNEEVELGAGYANQVFYSLNTGEVAQNAKNSWDLAFDATGMGSTIRINDAKGIKIWKYPHSNEFGNELDTTGITNWQSLINSDTSWSLGALNHKNNPASPFDLGWGEYSTITHAVNGNTLFIVQLNENSFKQLFIHQLLGGVFEFSYADLEGTNVIHKAFTKSAFENKNFGYYSIENDETLDLEPTTEEWDLLFTQYVTTLPNGMAYGVSGVLVNEGIEVAKAVEIEDPVNYIAYDDHPFSHHINSIGYDWKSFNNTTFSFELADDRVYFIQDQNLEIWKLVFTGFGGQSNGKYEFYVEQLTTASISDNQVEKTSFTVYPNPSNGNQVSLVYSIPSAYSKVDVSIYDYTGKVHYQKSTHNQGGLTQLPLTDVKLSSGGYLVAITYGEHTLHQKLIVQN